MVDEPESGGGFSLKRWSRRKLASTRAPAVATLPDAVPDPLRTPAPLPADTEGTGPALPSVAAGNAATIARDAQALPPVESLTHESDFAPFLKPEVDDLVRRAALKKLFSDPHFNVMDGLDTYIGDYSQPDPLPAEWLSRMRSAQFILSPPATRVNALGHVEDVPADEEVKTGVADASTPVAQPQPDTNLIPAQDEAMQDVVPPAPIAMVGEVPAEVPAELPAAGPALAGPVGTPHQKCNEGSRLRREVSRKPSNSR